MLDYKGIRLPINNYQSLEFDALLTIVYFWITQDNL